ncbi:MAG: SDR family NAD(P)-dependent oxidoreductase [Spirochaetaceae bacterium]|nr:SDR family NAD(P)-dependent oxidoreductase [Spirochaetaceae bacterium]
MQAMKLHNKVALVTGAGRGIGRAIALAFAREGADVALTARTAAEIEQVAAEVTALGRSAEALPVDLSDRAQATGLPGRVARHFPAVDILVNNAGIGSSANPRRIADYDDGFWDLSIAVNLTAPYLLTKALVPAMTERGWGRVINMASVAGKRGLLAAGAYTATKHGLIGLTRTAALETAGTGVTINAICPGATRTVMLLRRLQVDAELRGEPVDKMEANVNPLGRLLEPAEIAELAVYLASDDARGMTGQALNLSGGSTMH